jgi:hypothetical protein
MGMYMPMDVVRKVAPPHVRVAKPRTCATFFSIVRIAKLSTIQ